MSTCLSPPTTRLLRQGFSLTLILLMRRIWWAPNNASKWQMGFNSAFKGLNLTWGTFLLKFVDTSKFWLISDKDNRHFAWRHKHINYGHHRYILVTKISSVPLVTMVILVTKVISVPMKATISRTRYKFPSYGHFRICFVYPSRRPIASNPFIL
jgi:hypothetical protein